MKRLTKILETGKKVVRNGLEESLVKLEKGLWMMKFLAVVQLFFLDAACMEIFGRGKDLLQTNPRLLLPFTVAPRSTPFIPSLHLDPKIRHNGIIFKFDFIIFDIYYIILQYGI